MSRLDTARETTRQGWSFLIRPDQRTAPRALGARLIRPWHVARDRWRTDPALRVAVVCWLAAWVVLEAMFVAGLHYSFEGVAFRAFLPSVHLGVPQREWAAGLRPVCKYGYDGHQYYYISNDVFGRHDAYQHVDEVLYRYQRIGMPMLAGGLASLLGYSLTPAMLYHTVQFGIATAGFGVLVYWLRVNRQPAAYSLAWLLSTGTVMSLWMGLLDAPADAFFVFAMAAIFFRRLWLYVPTAILLLLTREMYCIFAFAVFSLAALARAGWHGSDGRFHGVPEIDWQDVRGYWQRTVLTALPGVVMLSWTAYLAVHFHMSPLQARLNNPGISSAPFKMMLRYLKIFHASSNGIEFRMAVVSAFTLILMLVLLIRGFRKLPLALLCTLPYVLMTTTLGAAIWDGYGSHMRVIDTALVIIGLFMLPFEKSAVLRFMLILQAIVGVSVHTDSRLLNPTLRSSQLIHEEAGYPVNPPGSPENALLNDLRSSLAWVDNESAVQREYHGMWDLFHREVKPVTVAVTNHTDVTWQPGLGKHPLWLGCRLYNHGGERLLATHSVILDKPIEPGETKQFTTYLELRRPGKEYVVEFSLRQEGAGWFVKNNPDFGKRYQITVR